MSIDAIRQHISEQFELARKLHERPRIAPTDIEPEVSLTDRAAPIFRRITATSKHLRRDSVCYEIVEPNIGNLETLFDAALISLGFNKGE